MNLDNVSAWAKELGFVQTGICSMAEFAAQKQIVACQPPLKERRQLRFEPEADLPWASALLVLLWAYDQAPIYEDSEHVFIDNYYYASNQAYCAAKELAFRLEAAGYRAEANVPYPAKSAAVRTGLGVIGDHGLLITPQYGSRVVIILMATDAVFFENEDLTADKGCLHCGRCIKACPTGALGCSGMEHPEKCLRNYMLEGSVVPEESRALMGMKMIGCDACQRVCPLQPETEKQAKTQFLLNDFVTDDERVFRKSVELLGQQIGRNTARPQRVKAQAALLAGNRKSCGDLAVLRTWSMSDFPAVREHARWAVEEIERSYQGLDQSGEKR